MIHIDASYAYLVLDIPFFVTWLLLFYFSKKTRKEQLVMSLILLPLGSISEIIYFRDYWLPNGVWPMYFGVLPIFIEDFIFSLSIGGIGAVVYESLIKRKQVRSRVHKHISIVVIAVIFSIVSLGLIKLGFNSIYATSIGFFISALLILAQRRDLFLDSIFSGLAVMIIMFLSYLILFNLTSNIGELYKKIWLLYGTPLDMRLFNIPMTEMVWGFTWGMLVGPIYEYWKDLRLR